MKSIKVSCFALGAVLFALSVPAQAEQLKKIPRIGYLSSAEPNIDSARSMGIRRALGRAGYIDGQNITIEYRYAKGKLDRLPELAAQLVRLKVKIIVVAGGNGPIRAAMNATKTIPIIMTGQGSDPIEAGFVESLAHPGGNITGFTNFLVQLGGKRLEALKEAVPKIARVAVPYVPGNRTHELELKSAETAAHTLKVTVQPLEIRSADNFDKVFAEIDRQRPDGLHLLGGPILRDNQKRIVEFAIRSQLPSVYSRPEAVDAGGLIYYGVDVADSYRRVASYVESILKGAKPADLPVEQPTKFELVINLKTARVLGLKIPAHLLMEADRVIE